MDAWTNKVAELQRTGEAYTLVTVIGTRGSSPRENGSKMVVTADASFDTIGGGHLEYKAIAQARELLLTEYDCQHIESYPLGATLGQCCGGKVLVLFEYFAKRGLDVWLFGAGHVAKAMMPLLAELPLRVHWVDSRLEQFPEAIPDNVEQCLSDDPVGELSRAKPGSYMLVLTHNHQLDYELTEAALKRDDLSFVGVIGSDTKALRFRQRLTHRQFQAEQIARLTCPVGLEQVPGKRPMEVAVSIVGQLIAHYQTAQQQPSKQHNALSWAALTEELGLDSP
ncbi:xanthine dehydrogenase accessory protein XdhC [Marinomonas ostreistagni]|uniref:xanthine dehydrogenase accessory protein XdhC n=1 Tax=Marinomonas ostreistagni TaxID=359209 RepID=UPI00194E540A|nr:xanthine dehydrogenase accessory protein XdhC [Marinomonas ostreistagni]MBM6550947.1 xanthine dehydrogenase accessory protein XdhC [Marinomonas ostreistagni]